MKRYGNLWQSLTSFENLYEASCKARRGKRTKPNVARFEFDIERQLTDLRTALLDGTYRPGPFHEFQIRDPKPRTISAAPYVDRIVHHAICNILEPIFERTFIHDSYACRVGKGTHAAVDRYTRFARGYQYVLKCDVQRFFPSVDHEVLVDLLSRKIKDQHVMNLCRVIIAHGVSPSPPARYFPGDDLFTPSERPRGLPIGNQTSQFFGNVMLNPLDHFVKETLGCRGYVRYADDWVILDSDPSRLANIREQIQTFLEHLRLRLHPRKRAISRTQDGIRFLGYRVFPFYRKLPAANIHRFRRRLRTMQSEFHRGEIAVVHIRQRIAAWIGHASHANTTKLRSDLLRSIIFRGPASTAACSARGLLEQQQQEHPRRKSEQEHADKP